MGRGERLVAAGRAEPHHIDPESTWTTRYISSDDDDDADDDADAVVELIRVSYDRVASGAETAETAEPDA